MKGIIPLQSSGLTGLVPADPIPLPSHFPSFLSLWTFDLAILPFWNSLLCSMHGTGLHFLGLLLRCPVSGSHPHSLSVPSRALACFLQLTASITLTCCACVCGLVSLLSLCPHQTPQEQGLLQFTSQLFCAQSNDWHNVDRPLTN